MISEVPEHFIPPSDGGENAIALLLRVGVTVSLGLVASGMALTFCRHPEYFSREASFRHLTSSSAGYPHSLPGLFASVRRGQGQGLVEFGLLVLIATPILRVGMALVLFWRQKDVAFTRITAGVLALLVVSLLLGRVG